jgi:hypothetical protein
MGLPARSALGRHCDQRSVAINDRAVKEGSFIEFARVRGEDYPLQTHFERLKQYPDPQRRGREFERLIADFFRGAHFRVERGPGTAKPRESDLLATSLNEVYLVECKWRKTKAGTADVDGLRGRLSRTPGPAIGVLISVSGYSTNAIAEVETNRDPPILLFGVEEIEELAAGEADLRQTLSLKAEQLLLGARAHLIARPSRPSTPRRRSHDLPVSATGFLATSDRRVPWVAGRGGYGSFAFTTVRTLGWGVDKDGFAVDLDLRSLTSIDDLAWALSELAALGWATRQGSWCLQYSGTNWHGLGAAALITALERRSERHEGTGRRRHSEEVTYVDQCAGGFWTLTAEADSEDGRIAYAEMSLQLQGIPFDRQPIAELARTLEVRSPIEFRTRGSTFDTAAGVVRSDLEVQPVALIIHEDESDPHDSHWVCGIVVVNPWFGEGFEAPPQLPFALRETELLVCSVRSWHPLSHRHSYRLNSCRWFSASTGQAVLVDVDWPTSELPIGMRACRGSAEPSTR